MLEVQNALEAKMDKIQAERMAVAIKEHAAEMFRPDRLARRRQPQGRRAGHRVLRLQLRLLQEGLHRGRQLIDKDKKVRVILKEFPIL